MAMMIKCKCVLLNMLLLSGEKRYYISNGKICELNKDFLKNTHKQLDVRPGKEVLMLLQRQQKTHMHLDLLPPMPLADTASHVEASLSHQTEA